MAARRTHGLLLPLVGMLLTTSVWLGSASAAGTKVFSSSMSGDAVVDAGGNPGHGSPAGKGTAIFKLKKKAEKICFSLNVTGVKLPASSAYIAEAPDGANGPAAIPLRPPNARGKAKGCVLNAEKAITAILASPDGYYVQVHTDDFPDGALRAQLK